MSKSAVCPKCQSENTANRYFCQKCGVFLKGEMFDDKDIYGKTEVKVMRILDNLPHVPYSRIMWNDTVDLYKRKVERYRAMMGLPEFEGEKSDDLSGKMMDFLELCHKPEFQIAFVGTIKTGKSTLINSLLGHNYASMSVTPETAALTKFRSSPRDYVKILFYTPGEWKTLWKSRTSAADAFMEEYRELNAEAQKDKWIGHEEIFRELPNGEIEKELAVWSSSKSARHYFVKEIEVGISSLPKDFPEQVVFVDTPGLLDPVAYRSEITKEYIRKANAVFVCVDAQKVQKSEVETIASVFSFSSHNKNKVHIIATHWDKLNNPIEDWEKQKRWFGKQMVGKAFFDNAEMASKNIMHAAPHIYNLCRDYRELGKAGRITLQQFALGMGIDIFEMMEHMQEMMDLTNIPQIRRIVTEELAQNYQALLAQDIEKKYWDIVYTLKRIAQEGQKELTGIINMSFADMEAMRKKIEEQKKDYDEIKRCRQQLTKVLSFVEQNTKKRQDAILSYLAAMEKSIK
ncbi:MAG: hypothetical protein HFH38_10620 [Lachnospiraceae bacterium]|jgi:GTPase Era involved in 16S rRNA processing|nr:hypothetical protein [Lachnospiraceae bacterium]